MGNGLLNTYMETAKETMQDAFNQAQESTGGEHFRVYSPTGHVTGIIELYGDGDVYVEDYGSDNSDVMNIDDMTFPEFSKWVQSVIA